jgi:hypothetical protein
VEAKGWRLIYRLIIFACSAGRKTQINGGGWWRLWRLNGATYIFTDCWKQVFSKVKSSLYQPPPLLFLLHIIIIKRIKKKNRLSLVVEAKGVIYRP